MSGNSRRQGAIRKPGSKKGATVGSGGQRRKALQPKGPTPKAEERVGHPAARRKRAAERSSQSPSGSRGGRPSDQALPSVWSTAAPSVVSVTTGR